MATFPVAYIVKNMQAKEHSRSVRITDSPLPGDKVLAGPFASGNAARKSVEYTCAFQRRLCLAEGEEIRIHASNGGYLFSVRMTNSSPTLFYDTKFSQQKEEFETPIELYPWLKENI